MWMDTEQELPPEGVVVNTMDSGFNEQKLVREGNLWFFEDKSMYVYYVPKAWEKND